MEQRLFSEMFLYQGLKMELKVKNLASSDSRGYDLQKEVMVKVTKQGTHQVRHPLPTSVHRHGPSQKASKLHRRFLPVAPRRLHENPDAL